MTRGAAPALLSGPPVVRGSSPLTSRGRPLGCQLGWQMGCLSQQSPWPPSSHPSAAVGLPDGPAHLLGRQALRQLQRSLESVMGAAERMGRRQGGDLLNVMDVGTAVAVVMPASGLFSCR